MVIIHKESVRVPTKRQNTVLLELINKVSGYKVNI